MPERPTLGPAAEIIRLHAEIVEALETSFQKAVRIGELLTEHKARLPHGEFLPWVAQHLPFTDRTARNYMAVYRERDQLQVAQVEGLGEAYRLLAADTTPKSETLSDLAPEYTASKRERMMGVLLDGDLWDFHSPDSYQAYELLLDAYLRELHDAGSTPRAG